MYLPGHIANFYTELLHAASCDRRSAVAPKAHMKKLSLRSSGFGKVGLGTWLCPKIIQNRENGPWKQVALAGGLAGGNEIMVRITCLITPKLL